MFIFFALSSGLNHCDLSRCHTAYVSLRAHPAMRIYVVIEHVDLHRGTLAHYSQVRLRVVLVVSGPAVSKRFIQYLQNH